MMDKNKMLPRLSHSAIETALRNKGFRLSVWMAEHETVVAAQRDADWKRVEPLVKALEEIATVGNYRDYVNAVPVKVRHVAQAALAQLQEEKP